jgi:PAP2 superfamily
MSAIATVRRRVTPELLRGARWSATACWAVALVATTWRDGIPLFRSDVLLWLSAGLAAASIGRRAIWTVLVDVVPLGLVLVVYDQLRGLSDTMGMPTWWHPQLAVDRALFFGREPTVWLQEHLKYPTVQWWDVVVSLCYVSFFFLPYAVAAVLWLRSRRDFWRWSARFVALSFLGFAFFALTPAAPPWAEALCSPAEVAGHPHAPACMDRLPGTAPHGGLLGPMTTWHPGAHPWVERTAVRGLDVLHLHFARAVITAGQGGVDLVAAVPSLHAGGIVLFVIFMWRRVDRWWRPVLVAYPLLMAFTLVYSAEHFLSDVLAGWLAAAVVALAAAAVERRLARPVGAEHPGGGAGPVDTLEVQPSRLLENPCPPLETSPPVTTPSST